jgi:hypothetical protein
MTWWNASTHVCIWLRQAGGHDVRRHEGYAQKKYDDTTTCERVERWRGCHDRTTPRVSKNGRDHLL